MTKKQMPEGFKNGLVSGYDDVLSFLHGQIEHIENCISGGKLTETISEKEAATAHMAALVAIGLAIWEKRQNIDAVIAATFEAPQEVTH